MIQSLRIASLADTGLAVAASLLTSGAALAQEITLDDYMLEPCASFELNGPACACFIDGLVEEGAIDPSGEMDDETFEALYYEYEDLAIACYEAN